MEPPKTERHLDSKGQHPLSEEQAYRMGLLFTEDSMLAYDSTGDIHNSRERHGGSR